jgi:glutamate synthase domain-containing protein 1
MSDSGNFDSVLELLAKASPRAIPECMMMMIPEAWQDNVHLSDTKRAFYEYNSCIIEPWVSVELLFLFSFLFSLFLRCPLLLAVLFCCC